MASSGNPAIDRALAIDDAPARARECQQTIDRAVETARELRRIRDQAIRDARKQTNRLTIDELVAYIGCKRNVVIDALRERAGDQPHADGHTSTRTDSRKRGKR